MNSKIKIIGLLGVWLLLFSCNPTEGCLDIEATNFDVMVEKGCDCCEYAGLTLQFSHLFDTLAFRPDSIYNIAGNDVQINDVQFIFSQFGLTQSGIRLGVEDTIQFPTTSGIIEREDNYMRVNLNTFTKSIGTFRNSGAMEGASIVLGLDDEVLGVHPDSLYGRNHALNWSSDSTWTATDGYIVLSINVIPEATVPSINRLIEWKTFPTALAVYMNNTLNITSGYDVSLIMTIDYQQLFMNIDFVNDSDMEISDKLVINSSDAFQVIQ